MKNSNLTFTNIVIAITVLMYIIQLNINYGTLVLGLNMYMFYEGFWWQPLSTMFAHGGIGHLGMNMFVLYQFGNAVERFRGKTTFFITYFVFGILTSFLSLLYILFIDNQVNLIGASGAICALLGYVALIDSYQRKGIITWILLISVAPLLLGLPIAWYSHLIGLVVGFLGGIVLKKFNL
ncbi:rhomboid family intramembrane serine protease [Malaciobacter molluscorum LMG 25693]|uniref:Rhomboid family intramembrane serine protease n=1 Tax=Malaciobacter molluscorum LMG 25693 TaxID=870501 RepID=A0A2G1DJ82_9BACT|nr:rhomboid family intramembrane serine protease [Malaciobacter molluscorum]AXX91653.1 rhomboid family membrane protein [Malaciobacter molluscorum LMG 25693]PHO18552.1 rhomboid family intramembrane serine protease [Malaciobacter molluscorum LMG 25693]RXJ94618.1 rhomboid family intramembrane serine protease [Malaciobacter molluscorum]